MMTSVVIATYNRAELLPAVMASIQDQVVDCPSEIIVVDNGSTDGTREVIASAVCPARYVYVPFPGLSGARNAGISTACGDIVVFIDDDAVASPGWLQAIVNTFRTNTQAWCVGGRIALGLPDALPHWFDIGNELLITYLSGFDLGAQTIQLGAPRGVVGANFAVRKDVFARVGDFSPVVGRQGRRLVSGDETDLCRRIHLAGGAVYYCGEAVVTHLVSSSRLSKRFFRHRAYWEGWSWRMLEREQPSVGVLLKDAAKAAFFTARGNNRRAIRHELAVWKSLGYLTAAVRRT